MFNINQLIFRRRIIRDSFYRYCESIRPISKFSDGKNSTDNHRSIPLNVPVLNESSNTNRNRIKHWRKRQQFKQILREDAGVDEASDKFDRQAPPDSRVVKDYLMNEVRQQRSIVQREMAVRKYYNFPVEDNLLTWSAKEQIFQLRQSDPETWTPEKLAESFPVSGEAVKRLLKGKWPPPSTGEDEEKVIRRHDDEVRERWILIKKGKTQDGLLSELTLNMIRTGRVKFLPMFAAGNRHVDVQNDSKENSQFSPTITPDDGPFVKLYKNHLQYLEKSMRSADSSASSASNGEDALVNTKDGFPAELKPFVFPEGDPGMENMPIQFEEFRQQLEKALKRRNRPEDRKYREWMEKEASSK